MKINFFWRMVYHFVAHPLEGLWSIFSFSGKTPEWLFDFHDWVKAKMFGWE